ncbi:hypothetical protein [Novipirellula artificiosorum]|uniref:Uncharacterized protein n=1 Tax=Novipirellula artificiosorum TaxID=2528016 RepID=A0A5C6D4Q4_9BACT|nr:hypothetical protein [Novipirellula artificiosorum]TWU30731.1 hypothetical protein Poly41_66360 [Novipirellula artificiosorum]
MVDAAASFNEVQPAVNNASTTRTTSDANKPGDDFSERGDVTAILTKHGWRLIRDGKEPSVPEGRIPRITRLLALAHRCYDLVRDGVIINQSELAHYGQISTTRMSQIMWLDNLAPDIQEQILDLPRTIQGRDAILEREVRPIAKTLDWDDQRKMWADILQRLRKCPLTEQN